MRGLPTINIGDKSVVPTQEIMYSRGLIPSGITYYIYVDAPCAHQRKRNVTEIASDDILGRSQKDFGKETKEHVSLPINIDGVVHVFHGPPKMEVEMDVQNVNVSISSIMKPMTFALGDDVGIPSANNELIDTINSFRK